MTSLINSTSITKDSNDNIISATSGGLLTLNGNQISIIKNNLNNLDLSIVGLDNKGLIWLGGSYPNGNIQVLDNNYNIIYDSTYLGIQSVLDFYFSDNRVFVVYEDQNDIGILEFNYIDNIPYYLDYYNNFPNQINTISDVDLFEDYIYLTTDTGILSSNINNNLKLSSSWIEPSYGIDDSNILYFYRDYSGTYLITEQNLFINQNNFSYSILEFDSEPFDILQNNEDAPIFCNKSDCYKINEQDFLNPYGSVQILYSNINYDINSFYKDNENIYFCIKNGGIMHVKLDEVLSDTYFIPNTMLQNKYDAISLLSNGSLVGISEYNGFIYDGQKFDFFIPREYEDLYPLDILRQNMNDGNNSFNILDYKRADKFLWSIVENTNGNILFNNSGIKPNFSLENRGAVVEINPSNFNFNLYDTSRTQFMIDNNYNIGVFDGLFGISNENIFDKYMVTNQLKLDNYNNVWCITPFSEEFNHIASIQMNDNNQNWKHIFSNDNTSYYPSEVAFDQYDRAWMGFNKLSTNNNSIIDEFSNGGLKVFTYLNSINNSENIVWFDIVNPTILPDGENSSILSLDIGKIDNQDILWVLTPQGVQGYIISGLSLFPIYPLTFYTNISFQEGDKVRVDSQNNAWVISQNGVRVIKNNASLWPNGDGFTEVNSSLLSDNAHDIAFDDDKGLVYISTNKGISIIDVPFTNNNSELNQIYTSPQPFVIPDDNYIEIKKLVTGSNVKILTINGIVIKDFELEYNENKILWDGRDKSNQLVSTGIYYITSYNQNKSITKKIAIIRN